MALGPLNLPFTNPPFPTPGLDLSHLFLLLRCWKRHPEASLSTFNSVPCAPPRSGKKGLMARRSPLPPLLLFMLLFQGKEGKRGLVWGAGTAARGLARGKFYAYP